MGEDKANLYGRLLNPAVRPRPKTPDDQDDSAAGARARSRVARPGATPGRRRSLPGDHVPLGAERSERHAVQLDIESVSRLHARLPLLLRAPLPDAVRIGAG